MQPITGPVNWPILLLHVTFILGVLINAMASRPVYVLSLTESRTLTWNKARCSIGLTYPLTLTHPFYERTTQAIPRPRQDRDFLPARIGHFKKHFFVKARSE